ncbi:MAG: AAA family ATPase, partial [Blastocatellia bacterium]
GWVLYIENSTDLSILRAFVGVLRHPAEEFLERPFVRYVETNLPQRAREHFYGLREAKGDLFGIAIFDRLEKELKTNEPLTEMMWRSREIENYFCKENVLLSYAAHDQPDNLFGQAETQRRKEAMREAIAEVTDALNTLGKPNPWSPDIKATDEFLEPLFKKFFSKLGLPLEFRKSDYHVLASLVPKEDLDPEVTEKLDAIVAVARKAKPATG